MTLVCGANARGGWAHLGVGGGDRRCGADPRPGRVPLPRSGAGSDSPGAFFVQWIRGPLKSSLSAVAVSITAHLAAIAIPEAPSLLCAGNPWKEENDGQKEGKERPTNNGRPAGHCSKSAMTRRGKTHGTPPCLLPKKL
jgi:hypothetical protein